MRVQPNNGQVDSDHLEDLARATLQTGGSEISDADWRRQRLRLIEFARLLRSWDLRRMNGGASDSADNDAVSEGKWNHTSRMGPTPDGRPEREGGGAGCDHPNAA
jgi:hypothetical protein